MTIFVPDFRSLQPSAAAATIMFFDAGLIDVDATDIVDVLRLSLTNAMLESDRVFRFRINPMLLEVRTPKITASTLTKAGYERSHFGNDWTRWSYSGSTGAFRPPNVIERAADLAQVVDPQARKAFLAQVFTSTEFDITQSPVWKKFKRWDLFCRRHIGETVMYFDGQIARGTMTEHAYTRDGNAPFFINYRFVFESHTDERSGDDRFGRAIKELRSF